MKDAMKAVGMPHMVMNVSPVVGADPGQEETQLAHILLPLCLCHTANHWLGVGAFLPTSRKALTVPSG